MPLSTPHDIGAAYEGREIAARYVDRRFVSELNRLLHDRQVEAVHWAGELARPEWTLEIAPGPGRVTRDVRLPGRLVCLELNEGMIHEGRRACGEAARWTRGNAFELPFAPRFDLVYSFRFIRHFHREDRQRLYSRIHRVLRPGGCLVFDAVNRLVSEPLRKAEPEAYPIYDKLYDDVKGVRAELAASGFEVVRVVPVQRWLSAQYRAQVLLGPRSPWLCRVAIRALERLGRGPALEWIVTCRRA
jgi:ubiquinone/menaquinone biosynthesis C-methylase UbiE